MRIVTLLIVISLCARLTAQNTYTESMGSVGLILPIALHELNNGFDQDQLTYFGLGDVRNSAFSTGAYPGASGQANVLLNALLEDFGVLGLTPNASCVTIDLTFGVRKQQPSENGSHLGIDYTLDGLIWLTAGTISLPTGSGTIGWYQRTITGIPGNAKGFRFRKLNANPSGSFRIDDVIIHGNGTGCSLPVELSHFEAKPYGNAVKVEWSTASELNNDYFIVERCADAVHFEAIGRVEGAGDADQLRNYDFMDDSPLAGDNYYRLRQVDVDGRASYGPVRLVKVGKDAALAVFPSPVFDRLTLSLDLAGEETFSWQVIDFMGRTVMEEKIMKKEREKVMQTEIDVLPLTPGSYFLRVVAGKKVLAQKFEKM